MFPNANPLSSASSHSVSPDPLTNKSSFPSKRWKETIAWVTHGQRLSRPIRNPPKDFSDGVLVAEIVAHHLPRFVLSLDSFPKVHSLALKRLNWEALGGTILRHLGIRLSAEQIQSLANAEDGTIQNFLPILRLKIEEAIANRRFRPSSTSRGSSRSCSRGGSQLHLDNIGTMEREREQQWNGTTRGAAEERPKVLDELDKDQLVEKLYAKVREQEAQLRKKDEHIESLSRKVDKLLEFVCEKHTND